MNGECRRVESRDSRRHKEEQSRMSHNEKERVRRQEIADAVQAFRDILGMCLGTEKCQYKA
jgi:hypothetical protein